MPYAFLSDEWFTKVEELVAAAGDLKVPQAMKVVEINVTVTGSPPAGEVRLAMKEGLFTRGHRADFATTLTLSADLARKIFVEGDTAAGVQAFLSGAIQVEGDLARLVAMQTVEPSDPQKQLTRRIAEITQ